MNYWRIHMRNTAILSYKFGKYYGLPYHVLRTLNIAAEFHDIGKLMIENQLLLVKKHITPEEYRILTHHSVLGADYLREKGFGDQVALVVKHHHERWDGKGYPSGLEKEKIPLLSRILALADTFDALTFGRPYKKAVGYLDALKEIERCSGSQFDPHMANLFIQMIMDEYQKNGCIYKIHLN